jgi:hypothetical protein
MTNTVSRDFYLNIDGDKILLTSVLFDQDTGLTQDQLLSNMFNTLSLYPSVIDISELSYMPSVGDVWDGQNFYNQDVLSSGVKPTVEGVHAAFSFVVDNVHSFYWVLLGTEETNMLIAALKSNPIISYEDRNV